MKRKILLILCLFCSILIHSQNDISVKMLKENEQPEIKLVNKGVNFGVSIGYNHVLSGLYEASLSPIDNTLQITSIPKGSMVLSTVLSIPLVFNSTPLAFGKRTKSIYRKMAGNKEFGPRYFIPYGFCILASVNVLSFNDAFGGTIFNKKIDGGLGIGYRINDDIQIGITYELISYKQPRSFLLDKYNGQTITVNNEQLTTLDEKDTKYFYDRYVGALSFKFVYLIRSNPLK